MPAYGSSASTYAGYEIIHDTSNFTEAWIIAESHYALDAPQRAGFVAWKQFASVSHRTVALYPPGPFPSTEEGTQQIWVDMCFKYLAKMDLLAFYQNQILVPRIFTPVVEKRAAQYVYETRVREDLGRIGPLEAVLSAIRQAQQAAERMRALV